MIVRADHSKCYYAKISTEMLRDPRLSLRAKGLLATLLTYPDDWEANVHHLKNICKEGETAIRSALKELKELGYLTVKKLRNKINQFIGTEQTFFENPQEKVVEMKPKQTKDPHFPAKPNAVRDRQEELARINSLGQGPWQSVEQKDQFRKDVETWARSRNYSNPGGYAHTICKSMVNGESCTLWEEWEQGIPLGSSDAREWELTIDGKTVTNPSFEEWLRQGLSAKDLSEVQISQQIANILNNPAKATKLWRDYKVRVINDSKEKERLQAMGVQGFTPPSYLSTPQEKAEPTYQEVEAAASNLIQFPTERATQRLTEEATEKTEECAIKSWADTIEDLIEKSKGTQFKFWRGAIVRAIAEQEDVTGEIEEIILGFSESEQKTVFDLLLSTASTRRWAQEHYPETLPIDF